MVSRRRLRGISCALRAGAAASAPAGSEGGEAALIERVNRSSALPMTSD